MKNSNDKTEPNDKPDKPSPGKDKFGFTTTVELPHDTFTANVPPRQRAYFEIIGPGEKTRIIELGEGEVFIGRNPECDVRLKPRNISRRHARVVFRSEEYHIEDLDSTNGTYVNGIKIVKCVLRDHDQIEIGGVKILFNEEMTLQSI